MTMIIEYEITELMYALEGFPEEIQREMYRQYKDVQERMMAQREQDRLNRNARDRARYARKK